MPMYAVPHTNNLKIFELVMNNGINPVTGDKLIKVSIDVEKATYNEILTEFKMATAYIIKKEEEYWNAIMLVHNDMGLMHPFMSALLDDCIEKGMDSYEGGCRYSDSAYVISCGMVNVANSLAAIKKNVFEEKTLTIKEIRNAIKDNFAGHEKLRKIFT